ncbi:MAG: hypothetical protein ABW076_07450 [Candidatus Thiodiazotropha sp.]
MNETFDVYFSGALLKDSDPDQVKRKIGAMFKLEGERLERLFRGKPVAIKHGVDMDRAVKFRVAFRDAGALVDIVPAGSPPPTPNPAASSAARKPPRPTAPPAASAPKEEALSLAAQGPLNLPEGAPPPQVPVPDYDLSKAGGFDLSDCAAQVTPQPLPDISTLDLNQPGAQLDESPDPAPLNVDTSGLNLDAPGVTLIESQPQPAPQIDTDELSLSPANQGSLEDVQKPVPAAEIPNIDHLDILPEEGAKPQGKAQFKIADE